MSTADRVARALGLEMSNESLMIARAAIRAMREPPHEVWEAMHVAAVREFHRSMSIPGNGATNPIDVEKKFLVAAYNAAIDAALKE